MILLPLLCLAAFCLAFRRGGMNLLESSAAALICFGLAVSVITELQSLTGAFTSTGSAVAWILAGGVALWRIRAPRVPMPDAHDAAPWPELGIIALFLLLTGAVALLSAPNSYDGLTYHLPRVERWIQQGSLAPFASHDPRQLFMPSWAEYAILQFRLLSGGDHFANLVEWLGLAGACLGSAILAGALGGTRVAMVTAALLVATLPMAVSQASGVQTDVVAACWAVLAAGFGYRLLAPIPQRRDAVLAGIALALAMATKQTAILFAGLVLAPVAVLVVRRVSPRRWLSWAGLGVAAMLLLAGPQLARNRAVFGSVRGEPVLVGSVAMETRAPAQVAGNVLRNLALHFGTPWPALNERVAAGVTGLSSAMGVDSNDPRTTWNFPPFRAMPWHTHEESAPNPLHLLLLLGCLAAIPWSKPGRVQGAFVAMLVVGFILFCAELKWQHYNSRLHTPWFVLALAGGAVMLERLSTQVRRALLVLLAVAALPNALLNRTRPLMSQAGAPTRPSIFSIPRNLEYFLYWPPAAPAYLDAARRISEGTCADVGVRSWGDSWVYPVMALVRTAGNEASFRDVDVSNASARFAGPSRVPCLLLQLGPQAASLPAWASRWNRITDWHEGLGRAGIAVFAPPA